MEQKSQFFDKRDSNYILLKSPTFFIEMCNKKNIKLEQIIPQTILFEKGAPKLWLFNSKKNKFQSILKKNSDKLNSAELVKSLLQIKDDSRNDNIQTLYENLKGLPSFNNSKPVAYVRLLGVSKRFYSRSELLKLLIDTKQVQSIIMIQSYIQHNSISNECYYVEYRQDINNLPATYKFYKSTLTKDKSLQSIKAEPQENNPFQQLIRQATLMTPVATKTNILPKITRTTERKVKGLFKYNDQGMNTRFQECSRKIVDYLESAFSIKIKKMIMRFMADQSNVIYFIGLKELMIDFGDNGIYDQKQFRDELISCNNFEFFMQTCKMLKIKRKGKGIKLPQQIMENNKLISSTLYRQLILERCGGDFCDFVMLEKNKGPLQLRKGIMENYKSAFVQQSDTQENVQYLTKRNLPYEINYQLVLRARECADDVISLFQRHRIQLKSYSEEKQEHDLNEEYPFRQFKKEVYNLENMYKKVKICKTCFILYSMISRSFDKNLKQDLKRKSWFNGEIRTQTEQKQRNCRSIKVYVVPKQNQNILPKSSKSLRISQAAKEIEINRLTLGYLNYQRLDVLKNANTKNQIMQDQEYQNKQFEENINLISMLAKEHRQPTRKLDSNQNENVHIIKLAEDLKYLRQDLSNDSDIRQIQQRYFNEKQEQEQLEHIYTTSYYYYHANFVHLRQIHQFRLSTPLQPITDHLKYDQLEELNQQYVFKYYPPPPLEIPNLKYFVVDEKTCIPYVLMESKISQPKVRGKQQKQMQSGVELLVIVHDMFESLYEYYQLMVDILQQQMNKRVLLFNIPGQSYTLFNLGDCHYMTNIGVSEILDMLLYHLHEDLQIDLYYDTLKLIGVGAGGYYLQTFLAEAHGNIHYLSSLSLVNSFSNVNEQLKSILSQSKEIFDNQRGDMPELAYEYTSTLMNTIPLDANEIALIQFKNPITIKGRIAIINGLLQSNSINDRFERLLISVQVYHSLKNCLINISEADTLSKFVQDDLGDLNNPIVSKKLANNKRSIEYFEGGHCVLLENREFLVNSIKRILY